VAFRKLPQVSKVATPDATGRNTGNWTNSFDTGDLAQRLFEIEIYRFIVTAGPVGSLFTSYINNNAWHGQMPGQNNGWSEPPAIPLRDGQTFFMFWNVPVTSLPAPTVLIWTRYDTDLLGNWPSRGVVAGAV
jgi:hypothetical protein